MWKWVWLPKGARCIDATWRFKVKITNAGLVDKLKARLCARGFKEIFGKDYIETHAPVTVLTSFRIALAEAARLDLGVSFFDISGAYLEADLLEDVYLEPFPGAPPPPQPGMVMKLIKALYGLKNAGRAWSQCLHKKLVSLGFVRAKNVDNCLYQRKDGDDFIRLNIHVDDCCATYTDVAQFEWLMDELRLEGWGLSEATDKNRFLGMEYERLADGAVALHQAGYIQEILAEFPGMLECKAQRVPHDSGYRHTKADCPVTELEKEDMAKVPYRRAIGMLRYLADGTRPEICATLGVLSQFQANPAVHCQEGRSHHPMQARFFHIVRPTVPSVPSHRPPRPRHESCGS